MCLPRTYMRGGYLRGGYLRGEYLYDERLHDNAHDSVVGVHVIAPGCSAR
jgi:hypothetical protein